MVQEKVGHMQSCCLLAQIPARGRGYAASSHSIPILREFFMWKEANTMAKEQQKKEMLGKLEIAQSFLARRRSGC